MGVYVLTSHCNFKTCVNVPHVNKTVTDFGGVYIPIYPPSLRPGFNAHFVCHIFNFVCVPFARRRRGPIAVERYS